MSDRTLYEVDAEPDIADWLIETQVLRKVEPCVHGNYARHIVQYHRPPTEWCDGKPEDNDE